MNILLLDDDPVFSNKIAEELVKQNHMITYFDSLIEAVDAVERELYDIIIIDLMLPPTYQDEGLIMLDHVKAYAPDSETVMISSRSEGMTRIVDKAYQSGARRFLDKEDPAFMIKLLLLIKEIKKAMGNSIFISFGHAELLKYQLKEFLEERLGKRVLILADQPDKGFTIVEKLEFYSEKCNKAIILLTKDDKMADGSERSRQNVIHELGFFQGKYGRDKVILLYEEGVELFSNISGILYRGFNRDHFSEVFEDLRQDLAKMEN